MALITRYPIDTDRSKSSDTIEVQARSVGALAADFFPELDTFASTIFTAGGVKWLKATGADTAAGPYTAKTKHDAFDQEVTTYTRSGSITLRYANGVGLMLAWNVHANDTNGSIVIGRAAGIDEGQPVYPAGSGYPLGTAIYQNDDIVSTLGIVKANYATDTLTFGVSGIDLYLKYNGVALDIPELKGSAWQCLQAGKILFSARPTIGDAEGTAGFRDISISYPAKPSTRKSNFTGKVLDLADFGIKSVETTGSISAASNQLTVASAAGFSVGDQIIVATGGETALSAIYSNTAAAGRRGTIGVGGTWPPAARLYADEATRLAASPADESYGALDTGKVYARSGGAWQSWNAGFYYFNMINPNALVAKITAIVGNVLTLDKTATAATSGAQVTFDCKPAFKPLTDTFGGFDTGVTLLIPKGTFWQSGNIAGTGPRNDWAMRGYSRDATVLRAPKGSEWELFNITGAARFRVSDFTAISNHDLHGYGYTGFSNLGNQVRFSGANITFADDCVVERMKFSECARSIAAQYTTRMLCRNIAIERLVAPDQCYLQWQIDLVDSNAPVMEDCTLDSNWLLKTYELFSSNNGVIRRCGGRNAMYALNSSQDFLIEDIDVVLEANSRANTVASPILDTNIIDINNNIQGVGAPAGRPPGSGGIIRRPRIVVQGYMDANNWVSAAINITGNPDVLVEGTYNPLVADDGQRKGLIQAPRSISSGLIVGSNARARIGSDAQRITVRNMRVQTLTADTPNGGATPSTVGSLITLYHASTATISGIAALGASGLGFCTLSTLSYWGGGGVIKVDNEYMEFTVTNSGTRTIEVLSRGFGGTTAATHSNGATATSLDYSTVENCIADVVDVKPTSTQTGNITNAAYEAL